MNSVISPVQNTFRDASLLITKHDFNDENSHFLMMLQQVLYFVSVKDKQQI